MGKAFTEIKSSPLYSSNIPLISGSKPLQNKILSFSHPLYLLLPFLSLF